MFGSALSTHSVQVVERACRAGLCSQATVRCGRALSLNMKSQVLALLCKLPFLVRVAPGSLPREGPCPTSYSLLTEGMTPESGLILTLQRDATAVTSCGLAVVLACLSGRVFVLW